MLACDDDHPSVRNSLILLPDPDCVGGGLGRACTVPGLPAGRVCCTRFLQKYFKYVCYEFDLLSGIHSTLQAAWFMSLVANTYIGVLAHRGEERREVQVHMVGLLKIMIQQYVRGNRWFGDYCCCCCTSPAILPTGTRMCLAYDTIIMDSSSSRPFHCFLLSIYTNPLHTRSTSYLQTTNRLNTTPYPLAVVRRFYGPSPLRLLPVLQACAEPQAGVSPPRRSPPGNIH